MADGNAQRANFKMRPVGSALAGNAISKSVTEMTDAFLLRYGPILTTAVIYGARMHELGTKRPIVAGAREETVTLKLFVLCGALMVAGGTAEYFLRDLRLSWLAFGAGVAISIGAFAIRRRVIRELGRFWSLHVEMRDGHEFIRSGPFARVRHPAYLSMILEHVGIALVLGAWIAFAVTMLIFIPTLRARLRREEVALVRQFGAAYEEYRATTPAILPFL